VARQLALIPTTDRLREYKEEEMFSGEYY